MSFECFEHFRVFLSVTARSVVGDPLVVLAVVFWRCVKGGHQVSGRFTPRFVVW